MTETNNKQFVRLVRIPILFLFAGMIIFLSGCDKEEEADFVADFSVEYMDNNFVMFENRSSGEYYSLIWDFGNGTRDTTTDRRQSYQIYYPIAGDYQVSLRVTNFTGSNKTAAKTISLENSNLVVSFSAEVLADDPNRVLLTNTTDGDFTSFNWVYSDQIVEGEMEHEAYFAYAGNYQVTLNVTKNGYAFSESQTIVITQDDPNLSGGLIWSEEFDYTGLPDPSKWNMETGGGGWGNNELQYYTNSENNAKVQNGVLTITAREEAMGGRDYTSARITTQNKFDFKYGRIEARIKLPHGKGIWPAFWMLGANFNSVGWPKCGEIDIMEMVGGDSNGDNTCHSTLHWDNNGAHANYGESYTLPSGIFADDFHVFAVEWDSQKIKGFVDEINYFTIDITPSQLSEFHENFFIIMNVAVGGNWPGSPNANTTFPQTMQVDYIRVYQENK